VIAVFQIMSLRCFGGKWVGQSASKIEQKGQLFRVSIQTAGNCS
jgi:hypothetical protein